MKVGILTVPFNNNYGGFLQAYALKTVIQNMGHEVLFINRKRNKPQDVKSILKRILIKLGIITDKYEDRVKLLSVNTNMFLEKYLTPITEPYFSHKALRKCTKLGVECFVVGSDQVWRYKYAADSIDDFFFSFIDDKSIKRFSYAASFGTDIMDYPKNKLKECQQLLKFFSGLSVREASGVDVLKALDITQESCNVVLDPTMLLSPKHYLDNLISVDSIPDFPYLLSYILDDNECINSIIKTIAQQTGLRVVTVKAQTGHIDDLLPLISVEQWISMIYYAKFVITDSFHGTVFSILFNKQFLVYGNSDRGLSRFESLLSSFSLTNRFVDSTDSLKALNVEDDIKWNKVNERIDLLRCKSLAYLKTQLNNNKD